MNPINEIKDTLTGAASKLGTSAADAAHVLQDNAKDAWSSARKETGRAVRLGAAYAHDHPLPIALIAAGLGVAFGFFLHRRGLFCGLLFASGALLSQAMTPCSAHSDAHCPAADSSENAD
jgi:ElaB/YqjD/DUF883 family membrane-anchored ribosome-binding protein